MTICKVDVVQMHLENTVGPKKISTGKIDSTKKSTRFDLQTGHTTVIYYTTDVYYISVGHTHKTNIVGGIYCTLVQYLLGIKLHIF